MALGEPVKVRLTRERHALLEAEAARTGKPLSTYLREVIEEAHELHGTLAALRRDVTLLHDRLDDLGEQRPSSTAASASVTAVQVETLLLLRALAGPDRLKAVRGELKRIGYDVWTPDGKEE